MKSKQQQELIRKLHKMNLLLNEILNIQFGIEDKEWINAMVKIEEGYTAALRFLESRSMFLPPKSI